VNFRTILTIAFLGYSFQLSPVAMAAQQMEEIIVTARATEESVREIPVAISVINEDRMNTFGIESFSNLEALTPQLTVARGGSGNGAAIGIRGISSATRHRVFGFYHH
jgi:iron complex outermembrane receptor protein